MVKIEITDTIYLDDSEYSGNLQVSNGVITLDGKVIGYGSVRLTHVEAKDEMQHC